MDAGNSPKKSTSSPVQVAWRLQGVVRLQARICDGFVQTRTSETAYALGVFGSCSGPYRSDYARLEPRSMASRRGLPCWTRRRIQRLLHCSER
jgi:hypothetical protein